MADDLLGVSRCGVETIELNSAINAKIESKKLNMGPDKCFRLHIGNRKSKKTKCSNILQVHNIEMKNATKIKYLGVFLNSQGSLDDTINDRSYKAIGLRSQLSSILKSISLGAYYFEVAMILRESSYLNAILCSSESWYYLTNKQMEAFEFADAKYFQICFQSSDKTAREAYYLETGKMKVRHIIVKRRFMFLFNILKREDGDLLKKTYLVQKIQKTRFDWYQTISQNKKEYGIIITDNEISSMSKSQFKNYIEDKILQKSLEELIYCKKAKLQNIQKSVLIQRNKRICMQYYLQTNLLSLSEKQFAFELRSRNYTVKSNYKSRFEGDMRCRLCNEEDSSEDEEHSFFHCVVIMKDHQIDRQVKYEHIYGELGKLVRAVKYFKQIAEKRKLLFEMRNIKL